jgi:hypothetical protein
VTAVPERVDLTPFGLAVGHATDAEGATGLTVVRGLDGPFRAAAAVVGRATGMRELGTLDPGHLVDRADAILLTGGSAYGLDAVAGVMRWLEAHGHGLAVGGGVVPIVPAAVVFDLAPLGRFDRRPTAEMAWAACESARPAGVAEGSVGAGTGATVGKGLGPAGAMKGGVGLAVAGGPAAAEGLAVAALAVVNAFGDVRDAAGAILAGARRPDGGFADTRAVIRAGLVPPRFGPPARPGADSAPPDPRGARSRGARSRGAPSRRPGAAQHDARRRRREPAVLEARAAPARRRRRRGALPAHHPGRHAVRRRRRLRRRAAAAPRGRGRTGAAARAARRRGPGRRRARAGDRAGRAPRARPRRRARPGRRRPARDRSPLRLTDRRMPSDRSLLARAGRHLASDAGDVVVVRAAIAPLLAEPRVSAMQASQALAGHALLVEAREGDWLRVRGGDDYPGWIHAGYALDRPTLAAPRTWPAEARLSLGCVSSGRFGRRRLPLGAVLLPGEAVEVGHTVGLAEVAAHFPPDPAAIVATARERFEGASYQWGGVTPWGADCSGLVQTAFRPPRRAAAARRLAAGARRRGRRRRPARAAPGRPALLLRSCRWPHHARRRRHRRGRHGAPRAPSRRLGRRAPRRRR